MPRTLVLASGDAGAELRLRGWTWGRSVRSAQQRLPLHEAAAVSEAAADDPGL